MTVTAKKIRPYVKVLMFAALLGAAAYVFFFLQDSFYPALTGSQAVFALQKSMGVQTVDLSKFESLVSQISQKNTAGSDNNLIADPFH